jgi:formyl-CoA transferase
MAEAEDRDGDEPGRGPLEGVTVVEVANFVSGPFGALMLADLGADVVKVEPPRGDPYRRFGRPTTGTSAEFVNVNRGKRSIALDLKDPEGLATLRRLLDRADVLLANWRPKVAGRLGLADHLLAQANPRLVRTSRATARAAPMPTRPPSTRTSRPAAAWPGWRAATAPRAWWPATWWTR